jgi:beta-galactosidase
MVSRGARAINYYAFYPMNAGYESGGYGMIQLDGTLTERSKKAGETAREIQENADLLVHVKPKPAEAAIVFSPLVPLLGGYDEEASRTAMHKALAGYHRMFFERNIPVEVLSSRELGTGEERPAAESAPYRSKLARYKLIVLPYPLMMTNDEAGALKEYVRGGGHLFIEARPGWVNEEGHAGEIDRTEERISGEMGRPGIYGSKLRGTLHGAGRRGAGGGELCGWKASGVRARVWQGQRDSAGDVRRAGE